MNIQSWLLRPSLLQLQQASQFVGDNPGDQCPGAVGPPVPHLRWQHKDRKDTFAVPLFLGSNAGHEKRRVDGRHDR